MECGVGFLPPLGSLPWSGSFVQRTDVITSHGGSACPVGSLIDLCFHATLSFRTGGPTLDRTA